MIYDCFTFCNELDVLKIRLNVQNEVVDRFVPVEATRTHHVEENPLFYFLRIVTPWRLKDIIYRFLRFCRAHY